MAQNAVLTDPINEGSDAYIQVTFTDTDGDTILSNNITSATMTLYDLKTETVINNQEDVDISGDFDEHGICTIHLSSTDNTIIDTNIAAGHEYHEYHVLMIKVITTSPNNTFVCEIKFKVRNLLYTPSVG
jgi:hypothetical protein